ncbi:MAG: DUF3849 domain-containing protein [Anaerofustis sp.]
MMDKTPVYKYPAVYARENDELEQYRVSYKANVACKNAIETAIRDNYRDNCLGKEAVKQVADQFGYERIFFVLANTVQRKDFDGRISYDNKDWAKTIHVFEDKNYFGEDRRSSFEVDSVNPGLTDIFINQARREYLLTQPLSKDDIQKEAGQILRRLQAEREPNSPSGTHFMARISPDFLIRASTKDHDRLFTLLPFRSLTFSTLKDRKGIFAFIGKDENRDQPLRLRKPSVKKQLQAKPTERKSPGKTELEW